MQIRRPKRSKKTNPSWMITYSDVMTLILIFFILFFASSQLTDTKSEAIGNTFHSTQILDLYAPSAFLSLNHRDSNADSGFEEPDDAPGRAASQDEGSISVTDEHTKLEVESFLERRRQLDELVFQVEQFLRENELQEMVSTSREGEGLILTLQDRILFRSGEAEIIAEAIDLLDLIGELLQDIPHMIRVEGHTDDVPISTERFPSNWELSAARASQVIRFLIDEHQIDPKRLVALGYGEHRPLDSNATAEGRQKNRRVVIMISDNVE